MTTNQVGHGILVATHLRLGRRTCPPVGEGALSIWPLLCQHKHLAQIQTHGRLVGRGNLSG